MADILDEVIKDHNDEKKIYYFRKIFPYIIIITSLIVAFMFVNDNKQKKQRALQEKLGDLLITANISNDKSALSTVSKSSTKIAQLALLKKIANEIDNGNTAIAKEILIDSILSNNKYDEMINTQIRLIWLKIIIDQNEISNSDKEITNKCFAYFSDKNVALQNISKIYEALWYIKTQDVASAERSLQVIITNTEASENIKEQARLLSTSIRNNGQI